MARTSLPNSTKATKAAKGIGGIKEEEHKRRPSNFSRI
jgi:hypothetical protein